MLAVLKVNGAEIAFLIVVPRASTINRRDQLGITDPQSKMVACVAAVARPVEPYFVFPG